MILLDTNVLSALMQRAPSSEIAHWLDRQPQTSVWTTSITIFEIRIGIESMQPGRRQTELASVFDIVLEEIIQQRIASFDARAAGFAASLSARRKKSGRNQDERDTMIAAIALASRATLATRNIKHFDDIASPVVNPFAQSG